MSSYPNDTVRVAFTGFWPEFDPEPFFVKLLASSLNRPVQNVRHLESADIVVSSVFSPTSRIEKLLGLKAREWSPSSGKLSIWYSGENIRPPHDRFNLTLSFDVDDFGGANQYLPLAYLSVHWPWQNVSPSDFTSRETAGFAVVPSVEQISIPRALDVFRPKFACMFASNMTNDRRRLIGAMETIGPVDVYGPAEKLGPVKRLDKVGVAKDYRFMLCPENDLFPGYVTEKIVDAWASGCVPIWWGDDSGHLLNPGSHLNLANTRSLADLIESVRLLENDASRRRQVVNSPLSNGVWSLDKVKQAIGQAFTGSGMK